MDSQNYKSRTTNALDFTFSPNIKTSTSSSLPCPASAPRIAKDGEGRNKENEEASTSIDARTKQVSKGGEVCGEEQEEFLSLRKRCYGWK